MEYKVKRIGDDELYHYGVLGMKWGVRKDHYGTSNKQYRSTSIKSRIARSQNRKVDASFNDWQRNADLKKKAVEAGKKAMDSKINKDSDSKKLMKEYNKALRKNTTYRKGSIKSEVGQYAARKYLSEAKRVKKQLDSDPKNKELKKKYNDLMSKHDVERAKARKASGVGERRSKYKAKIKRAMTISAKAAVTTAVAGGAIAAVNKAYGKNINTEDFLNVVRNGRKILTYMY